MTDICLTLYLFNPNFLKKLGLISLINENRIIIVSMEIPIKYEKDSFLSGNRLKSFGNWLQRFGL
jgi:hypothetical protein